MDPKSWDPSHKDPNPGPPGYGNTQVYGPRCLLLFVVKAVLFDAVLRNVAKYSHALAHNSGIPTVCTRDMDSMVGRGQDRSGYAATVQ